MIKCSNSAKWEQLSFDEAVEPVSDGGKRVDQRDYLPSGSLPVIDQGESYIGGYTDDLSKSYTGSLPVVVFGDHTRRVKLVDERFAVGAQGVKLLRPREGWDPKFFAYLLLTLPIPNRGYSRHYQFVRKLTFRRPDLPEQRRIVAEIEKQFTRLDVGVASLKRVQTALKRYRASVLKAACKGRLTDDAKEHVPLPEALLSLVESNHVPASAEENLPALPALWRWVQVGKVFQMRQGVQIPKSEQREAACPGFKRYLYISDFKHSESLKFVEDTFPSQEVTERDLVMANTGSPGEVFLGTSGILSNNLFRISFDTEHFAQRFVYYYFKSPLFLSRIKLKGGAQQHLGHRTIAAHLMPLPPLADQTRIVAEVERRLSVVEELESVLSANLQRAVRFRQSILQNAFKADAYEPENR